MDKRIVANAVESISYYLTSKEKRKAVGMFFLLLFASVLDVFGLASLVPVIMAATTPNIITTNEYLSAIYHFFNFSSERSFLLCLIISLFLFFLLKNIFTTWITYQQVRFTASLALSVINRQFNKYANLPFWDFNNEGSGKLINNVLSVPQYFVTGIIRPVFILFSEIAIIAVIIIGILIYQPVLFLILITVLVPAAMGTYHFLKKRSESVGNKLNELRPVSYTILNNTFNGFIELKLANKLYHFKEYFLKVQRESQDLDAKSYLYSQIPLKVIEMVAILGVVTIFVYSIFFTSGSDLVAIIGLFAAAAYRLMPSINRLLTSMLLLKTNAIAITELKAFKEYDKVGLKDEKRVSISFNSDIVFKDISFSFPGASLPTLSNISFTVRKGEKIGFVGASGSGKTTLMNILLRFYLEHSGSILVDGKRLEASNKEGWYEIVGYVKQDTFLMEASIKDNITLGDSKTDDQRLEYALEQASLKDFVSSLPDGVHTLIGEKGSRLSGGQKQRIGIARALYKKAQVLVLDEATSALDTTTEREVSEAIDKLSQTDITVFIIAHRITTLRDCDRIYEMRAGKIVSERLYEDVLKEVM